MRMNFYSPHPTRPWNWQASDGLGISQAQFHHANMCVRMADRGHECTSYVPLLGNSGTVYNGVTWRDLSEADLTEPGAWIIYAPQVPATFGPPRPDQYRQLVSNPSPRVDAQLLASMEASTTHDRHDRLVACFGDHRLATEVCSQLPGVKYTLANHETMTVLDRYRLLLCCSASLCLFDNPDQIVTEAKAAGATPVFLSLGHMRLVSALSLALSGTDRQAIMDATRRDYHWGREASMWHTIENHLGPRRLIDQIDGATYQYDAHYIYTHLGERQSREKWLKIGQNGVFLDIGAAVGSWTLPAAALGATVYAFDPGNDADMLVEMVKLNHFEDRVTLIRQLVSDKSGRNVPPQDIPWFSINSKPAKPTTTISIDDFVASRNLERVDFIKVDTDGGEREVLAGMRNTLSRFRPPIVVETHDFLGVTYGEIVTMLEEMNYECTVDPKEDGYYYHVYGLPKSIHVC